MAPQTRAHGTAIWPEAPLSEPDYDKLKDALHAMEVLLARSRNTEKTNAVVGEAAGAEACSVRIAMDNAPHSQDALSFPISQLEQGYAWVCRWLCAGLLEPM